MTPERTRQAFERILAALRRMDPVTLRAMRPGLAHERWDVLRAAGVPFPVDARPVWDLHDGEDEPTSVRILRGVWRLLTLFEIRHGWKWLDEQLAPYQAASKMAPDPRLRADFWHPGWVPIAENGGGDWLLLDTAPGDEGRAGQVILHQPGMSPYVLAESLGDYLAAYADELEAGKWRIDENDSGFYCLVPHDEP